MRRALVLLAGLALIGGGAARAADNLDQLLATTQAEREATAALAAERMATFEAAPATEQQSLMQEALAARADAEAASKALLERYGAAELRIGEANQALKERMATLGLAEIFGLARQVAGDSASLLQQSLLTARLDAAAASERRDFLRTLAAGRTAPSAADLERLWLELQREMTAAGRVNRFPAPVVQADGSTREAEVVAIGPFTAVADGDYLAYQPELGSLIRHTRQPPEPERALARQLAGASGGYQRAVVDPTRGVLLAMVVERPSWIERVRKGEEVGYVIIAVGALGLLLWALQFIYLVVVRLAVWRQLRNLGQPSRNNPLGRVLLAFKGDLSTLEEDAEIAELRISEAVLREVPRLERFQAFLRLAVAAGPLLGLIGTVVGMIVTFQAITESGSSDPKLMADGIGQAMIATVLGLGIAIPLLFGNAMLTTLSRAVVQILDEQSAGLLASSLEQRRRA